MSNVSVHNAHAKFFSSMRKTRNQMWKALRDQRWGFEQKQLQKKKKKTKKTAFPLRKKEKMLPTFSRNWDFNQKITTTPRRQKNAAVRYVFPQTYRWDPVYKFM